MMVACMTPIVWPMTGKMLVRRHALIGNSGRSMQFSASLQGGYFCTSVQAGLSAITSGVPQVMTASNCRGCGSSVHDTHACSMNAFGDADRRSGAVKVVN